MPDSGKFRTTVFCSKVATQIYLLRRKLVSVPLSKFDKSSGKIFFQNWQRNLAGPGNSGPVLITQEGLELQLEVLQGLGDGRVLKRK